MGKITAITSITINGVDLTGMVTEIHFERGRRRVRRMHSMYRRRRKWACR